jgi:hypothetical protein
MTQDKNFFIDLHCEQSNHYGELICGDVYTSKYDKENNRWIVVLSDGMGSGVKANILATLTASMALNFALEHREIEKAANIIMNTLPVCSERKISYSTFTIIEVDDEGNVSIAEYDNPECLILRGDKIFDPGWENIKLKKGSNKNKIIRISRFKAQKEDRIFFWSDGIVQAGMGTTDYPFGWERENLIKYVTDIVKREEDVSSIKLAKKIVRKAMTLDEEKPKDDTSCGIVYLREPRKILLLSGPPFKNTDDKILVDKIKNFKGKKIIAGGTTAEIIAREMNLTLKPGLMLTDNELPPVSYMEGFELVTEGILTLGKVATILDEFSPETKLTAGPAHSIVKLLLNSDLIHIICGTSINEAHQDPNLPVELEIRRTVIKKTAKLLEEKFLRQVTLEFI